jgi:hypothetical protein
MLTLAMQSGAFLHLVVTLTALVARMAHLSSAVRGVLSTLHAECAHLLAKLYVRSKRAIGCNNNVLLLLVQPTEASHNLARPLPPPPLLEGEDTTVSGAPPRKRTVPDSDLDASVDLGETIARTPALIPRPKPRSASPVLPDDLSLVHDATLVVAGQPGERKRKTRVLMRCTF